MTNELKAFKLSSLLGILAAIIAISGFLGFGNIEEFFGNSEKIVQPPVHQTTYGEKSPNVNIANSPIIISD